MTSITIEERTLAAAALVMQRLEADGVRCALVGATALAVHGYSRATEDVDIGVAMKSLDDLRRVADAIRGLKMTGDVALALPDADDPLGGVITITGDDIRQIQVINFINPLGIGDHPGREAIASSVEMSLAGMRARVVDVEHLVAMKLFAGGAKSVSDVVELIAYNANADLKRITELCAHHGISTEWNAILPEIEARRARR